MAKAPFPSPALTGAFALLLYLAFPSYLHNFDGLACAIAVELGDLKHLAHGNHLLYGVAAWLFHRTLELIGLRLDALWSLKVLGALLGAAGAAQLHRLLLRQGVPPRLAALGGAGLAISYGWWLWSLEPQVYMLGSVLLLATAGEALKERPSPARLAGWHALAILTHLANVLLVPLCLWAIWREGAGDREGLRRDVGRYVVLSAVLVLAGYLAAAELFVRPESWPQTRLWLLGSLALGEGRSFLWHGAPGLAGLWHWAKTGAKVVSPAWPLSIPLWLAALWSLRGAQGPARRLAVAAWLWLPAYALLFHHWEPFTLVYRVSDLAPLWLAAAAACGSVRWRRTTAVCAGYVALLAAANLLAGIRPIARPAANAVLQEALWIREQTPEPAWVAAWGDEEVYIPYFAHRRTLNLRYFQDRPDALSKRLWELMETGDPIYVTSRRLLHPARFPPVLGLQAVSRRGDLVLYRITSIGG